MLRRLLVLGLVTGVLGCGDDGGGGTPAGFTITVLEAAPFVGSCVYNVFAEKGASGRVHAAYLYETNFSGTTYALKHFDIDQAGVPTAYTVDTPSSHGFAFDVGPSDSVHVVYSKSGNFYYATNATGIWVSESLAGNTILARRIVVDNSSVAYIPGYIGTTTDQNRLIKKPLAGAWSNEIISSMAVNHSISALAVGATGQPQVLASYSPPDTTQITMHLKNGALWSQTFDTTFPSSVIHDVEIASDGKVYMLLSAGFGIVLMEYNPSTSIVKSIWGGPSNNGAVALNSSGKPYVAYSDGAGRLSVATEGAGGWHAEIVDPFAAVINGSPERSYDVTITADGVIHVVYYDETVSVLYHASGMF